MDSPVRGQAGQEDGRVSPLDQERVTTPALPFSLPSNPPWEPVFAPLFEASAYPARGLQSGSRAALRDLPASAWDLFSFSSVGNQISLSSLKINKIPAPTSNLPIIRTPPFPARLFCQPASWLRGPLTLGFAKSSLCLASTLHFTPYSTGIALAEDAGRKARVG